MSTIRPSLASACRRKLAAHCCRARHISSSSRCYNSPPVPSIARLLDEGPPDPDHVVVNGYVRSIRELKRVCFANIGDGSSQESMQAVLTHEQAKGLSYGSAVKLSGTWKSCRPNAEQSHELEVSGVDIYGPMDASTYPMQKGVMTPEFLRTIPHMRTRTPFNSLLLRLRSSCIAEISKFLNEEGFTQTHTPIITSSDCEGAGEVFNVRASRIDAGSNGGEEHFFKVSKYLTVSSQLHLEALAQSVGNVWTLSPTFRAERSDTSRHLSEFYMLELEMSFVDDMKVVMDMVEKLIQHTTRGLLQSRIATELTRRSNGRTDILAERWKSLVQGSWPRITYTKAIELLGSSGEQFDHLPKWGEGLGIEHEKYLAGLHKSPVFVTHYPRSIKAFYMLASSTGIDQKETVDCFDLLLPDAGEVVGGSMREHRLEPLVISMQDKGLVAPGPLASITDEQMGALKWYIDLRRWGSIPHGGFGLGFDRLLGYLADVPNIREINTFPRWVGRCEC